MPAAKGQHDGNDHRVLTGTPGQNCPVDPERQTTVLGGAQVGETVGARVLANPAVVRALEALAAVACPAPIRSLQASEEAAALHSARTCYDHLAGALGVALTQALVDGDVLDTVADGYTVTTRGAVILKEFGLDLDGVRRRPRLFAPRCLDWSERQHHVAGALGAALAGRLFELGWIARVPVNRAVRVTTDGRKGLRERFDLDLMADPCRAETE